MDQTDNAPGVGASSDASVNSGTHQRTVPIAVMQTPPTSDTPPAATTLYLGINTLGKRKTTESLSSIRDCRIGAANSFQQASLEPVHKYGLPTPSGNTKKRKLKDERSDHGSPRFPSSDLFVEQDDTSTTTPARTASPLPEGVTAFLDASITTFSDELCKNEYEQGDLPTALPQPTGGPVCHKVGPYDTVAEKKDSSLSIDRPSFAVARRIEETIFDFVLATIKWLDGTYGELHDDEIPVDEHIPHVYSRRQGGGAGHHPPGLFRQQ